MQFPPQLRLDFQEQGFLFFPEFISSEEVRQINERLAVLIQEQLPSMSPEHAFYEGEKAPSTLKQIQVLYRYDPFFAKKMFGSKFEQLAAFLLNDAVTGKNMQYFNKPPKIGLPTPPHQDGYYFMLDPPEAVTMWLALDL